MTAVSWIALLGRDYPRLGPVAHASLDAGGAVALSRGAYVKPYAHVDPNEDGALVVRAEDAALACVVDGYNGAGASERALNLVRARAYPLLAATEADFTPMIEAIVAELSKGFADGDPSRCCLVVATARGGRCRWASFGDSALFRASKPAALTPADNRLVISPGLAEKLPAAERWSGAFALPPGERIATLTDGVVNFVRNPAHIATTLREAERDMDAAVALVRKALLGGAGDNVAVATLRA